MRKKDIDDFKNWLLKQQNRDDSIGDFAKDFLQDCDYCEEIGDSLDFRSLLSIDSHLVLLHSVSNKVLEARDKAWREFSLSRIGKDQ